MNQLYTIVAIGSITVSLTALLHLNTVLANNPTGSPTNLSVEKKGLNCLAHAYQGQIISHNDHPSHPPERYMVLSNQTKILWDDHTPKTFEEKLANPDLEDTLSIPYPLNDNYLPLLENQDPGRIRSQSLLKAVYGATPEQVRSNLTTIKWAPNGKNIRFNIKLGAAKALEQVGKHLATVPGTKRFTQKLNGTFKWRMIKDTNRLSAHSFGIAVDIDTRNGDYWKWAPPSLNPLRYKNRIPMSVVAAFEKYNFIWGGKWYHYDTMHFEYRPELICFSTPNH